MAGRWQGDEEACPIELGTRIVVRTPDRREFRGWLVGIREGQGLAPTAVVRLDTGWVTAYPLRMVTPDR